MQLLWGRQCTSNNAGELLGPLAAICWEGAMHLFNMQASMHMQQNDCACLLWRFSISEAFCHIGLRMTEGRPFRCVLECSRCTARRNMQQHMLWNKCLPKSPVGDCEVRVAACTGTMDASQTQRTEFLWCLQKNIQINARLKIGFFGLPDALLLCLYIINQGGQLITCVKPCKKGQTLKCRWGEDEVTHPSIWSPSQ